jgi:hypothetical protein
MSEDIRSIFMSKRPVLSRLVALCCRHGCRQTNASVIAAVAPASSAWAMWSPNWLLIQCGYRVVVNCDTLLFTHLPHILF